VEADSGSEFSVARPLTVVAYLSGDGQCAQQDDFFPRRVSTVFAHSAAQRRWTATCAAEFRPE